MTVQDKSFTHPQSTFDPIGWHSGTPFPLWLTWRETLSHNPENVEDDSKWLSLTKLGKIIDRVNEGCVD